MSVKVVVIDSGVKRSHVIFQKAKIISYELNHRTLNVVMDDNDSYGHGTAVTGLICQSLERHNIDYEIAVIKAFENDTCTAEKLLDVLTVVYDNMETDIINLSLGMVNGKTTEIVKLCEKLMKKSIIVSAASNSGNLSIPCAIPGVIGVISDNTLTGKDDYYWIDSTAIQMAAYGRIQRVPWNGPEYFCCGGNSFACANTIGIIAQALVQSGKTQYIDHLMRNGKRDILHYQEKESYSLSLPYKVKKAAIFPFSKETSSFVLFSHLLGFEICDIYDLPLSGKVGAKASELLGIPVPKDYVIKNINEFTGDAVDTVIVGHLQEYLKYEKEREKIKTFLQKCERETNFYFFDPMEEDENLFSPTITKEHIPPNIANMMYSINTPVLGVFGTSSKQGKFTLQLLLREEFMKAGYTVGQLGTEPESLLFGFDAVYPMGYNSGVDIHGTDAIRYLNRVLYEIESNRDVDLILTGSQSGTVPYSCNNINNITIPETEFLFGTCPDVVVLCVNLFDEVSYIQRTIRYIESGVNTKVLALVVFPKGNKKDPQYMEQQICALRRSFPMPVYVLNKEMDKLCNLIVDYLSA